MISLSIKPVMIRKVVTFPKDASVVSMAKKMSEKQISCVVIIDKAKKPLGVLTERDIITKIVSRNRKPDGLKAKDVMSKKLLTINEQTTIFYAAQLMGHHRIRRLPVVKDKKLVGLITETDVVKAMTGVARYLNDQLIKYIVHS